MTKNKLLQMVSNYCQTCRGPHDCIESCDPEWGRCSLFQVDGSELTKEKILQKILAHCSECLGPDGERFDCGDCSLREIWNFIPA